MRGRLNRLVCSICLMLCGIYSVQISAATAGSAVFQAYSVLGKKRVGSNIRVDYAVKTSFEGSHIPRYKKVSVDYTPDDLAAMFYSLKNKSPSSAVAVAGLGAIVGGAGWAIDELTGQITKPITGPADSYKPGRFYDATVDGQYYEGQTFEEVVSSLPSSVVQWGTTMQRTHCSITSPNATEGAVGRCRYQGSTSGFYAYINLRPCSSNPICLTDPEPVTTWEPVPDDDVLDEAKKWVERAPLGTLDDLFRQPSGNPSPTDKLRNAIRDWLRDLADGSPDLTFNPPDTIVVTNPDGSTTTVENTDPAEDTASTPSQQPGTASSQWPGFCEWAPVVCDWIDWTQEMPEDMQPEDFPVETLTVDDLRKDYDSGLGSGSCPSPVTTDFMGSQIVFSYETACYGATTYFKPILLMIAGIIAAFIIVGASRRT